jgi:hypothetical protein
MQINEKHQISLILYQKGHEALFGTEKKIIVST